MLDELHKIESLDTSGLCKEILKCASASPNKEALGLSFALDLTDFTAYDRSVLLYEKEKDYYDKISRKYTSTIEHELLGKNEYNLVQDPRTSRRFVYADSSCITYINTQVRDSIMCMKVVCRSSDVLNTFYYDISFLQILALTVREILSKTCAIERVIMKARLDSAHIPN